MQTSESVEEPQGRKPRLKREIGLWMAVALVVGNMAERSAPVSAGGRRRRLALRGRIGVQH